MKAPLSDKAKNLLNKKSYSPYKLVKELLVGSKNGLYTEGHQIEIEGKKYVLKKVSEKKQIK